MQQLSLIIDEYGYTIHPNDIFFFNGLIRYNYKFGEILINFMELDVNDVVNIIGKQEMQNSVLFIENFLHDCQVQLSSKYAPILTALLLNEVEQVLVTFKSGKIDDAEAKDELKGRLENIKILQRLVELFLQKKGADKFFNMSMMQSIQTRFYYDDEKSSMSLLMEVQDIFSLISLEIVHVQKNKIVINQCQNCHRYFFPVNRSDEIYCDRIIENGKTCKQIGYENTMDEFQRYYRKEYKTQHRRIAYNQNNIKDYKEKHFEPWVAAAQKALKEYKRKNDLDGFKNWLIKNRDKF